jgi:hypothetical protein
LDDALLRLVRAEMDGHYQAPEFDTVLGALGGPVAGQCASGTTTLYAY